METLCFEGYYTKGFARCREFMHRQVEAELDRRFAEFCNLWLQEEFTIQSGGQWYERSDEGQDRRNGHYWRRLMTGRGVVDVRVPRGEKKKYEYTLFEKNRRKTKGFEGIVADALLNGHSSRQASKFFENMFGAGTISHQAAVSALRKYDGEVARWKQGRVKDNPVVLVLDAVHFKGVISHYRYAKPVLFADAAYGDGREEVLDCELVGGESTNAYYRFCLNL